MQPLHARSAWPGTGRVFPHAFHAVTQYAATGTITARPVANIATMTDRRRPDPGPVSRTGIRGTEDWRAVATAVNERMAARRLGQQQLADLAGVSVSTLRLVQRGAERRVRTRTLFALSRALGWPDDHLVRVLHGAVPATGSHERSPDPVSTAILACVGEIRDELRQINHRLGELVAAGVPTA
jgi:DNA-binding Xre family transcriptional regulator